MSAIERNILTDIRCASHALDELFVEVNGAFALTQFRQEFRRNAGRCTTSFLYLYQYGPILSQVANVQERP